MGAVQDPFGRMRITMIGEKEARAHTTGTGNSNTQVVIKSDNTNHGVEAQKLERVQAIAIIMAVVKKQDIIQKTSRIQSTGAKKV
jgi:hypothetical protein